MTFFQILKNLNLNKKEASIYLSALELGSATASEIARKSNIQRTYFYDVSKKLIKEGFLKETKDGKKRLFSALEPDSLVKVAKNRYRALKKSIPRFKAIHNTAGKKPKIYYYQGREGIDKINNDTLNYKGEILGFTTPRFVLMDNRKLSKEYIKKRVNFKIKVRIIGENSKEIKDLKERDWKELRETRSLPQEIFSSNVEIGIYGNKLFIVDYKGKFGFIIEGSEISKAMKKIFEIVWKKAE